MDSPLFASREALVDYIFRNGFAGDRELVLRIGRLSLAGLSEAERWNLILASGVAWQSIEAAGGLSADQTAFIAGVRRGTRIIHSIPHPPPTGDIAKLAAAGAIVSPAGLVDGAYYFGTCRNGSVARYDASKKCFFLMRRKLGSTYADFYGSLHGGQHSALFLPYVRVTPARAEIIRESYAHQPWESDRWSAPEG